MARLVARRFREEDVVLITEYKESRFRFSGRLTLPPNPPPWRSAELRFGSWTGQSFDLPVRRPALRGQ
jgi:hypothetical protein